MIQQKAGIVTTPWATALERISSLLDEHQIRWWLVGSAALAVRGRPVEPHDIELVVEESAALRLGELLEHELIEPLQPITTWNARWYGRAFSNVCIEWVGGVGDGHIWSASNQWEHIQWRRLLIRVPTLATDSNSAPT